MKPRRYFKQIAAVFLLAGVILLTRLAQSQEAPSGTAHDLTAEEQAARKTSARQRAEEGLRQMQILLSEARAKIEALIASRPQKPYDPEAARAAEETRMMARKRSLAP